MNDWDQVLQRHRKAQIEKLRAVNRRDINVSKTERAEIERAARGVWHSPFGQTPEEPPVKWQSDFRTREFSTGRRR